MIPDFGETREAKTPTGPDGGDDGVALGEEGRRILRKIAMDSIRHGLDSGRPLEPELKGLAPALLAPGAVFVTLKLGGNLRGCIGSFEAKHPLARDVARNAYSAAFTDFRFPPMTAAELPELELHISLLTPLVPFPVADRQDLLRKLRPGVDGLLIEDPPHRSTFLPQVWESLPEPEDFLGELLQKAGLPRGHWSATIRFHRYGVEEF